MRTNRVRATHSRATSNHLLRTAVLVGCAAAVLAACAPSASQSGGEKTQAPSAGRPSAGASAGAPAPTPTLPRSFITNTTRLEAGGCPIFPQDHAFRASIGGLSVKSGSAATIAAIGPSTNVIAGFSSSVWMGSRLGLPINYVDSRTAPKQDVVVSQAYAHQSTTDDVPWPDAPRFEGWPGRAWDKHLLIVDVATCTSWELINVQPPGENLIASILYPGRWYADKVVQLDLRSNSIPPLGTVTASGLSMLAGLVRYDEVAAGLIDHALTIGLPTISSSPSIWPAYGSDGNSNDPAAPPMGSWLRLRADVDLSGLGPQARVVAQALKDHGAVLVDTSPKAAIGGEPDVRWNDTDLGTLSQLTISQFEIVDATPMKVADGSYQIR